MIESRVVFPSASPICIATNTLGRVRTSDKCARSRHALLLLPRAVLAWSKTSCSTRIKHCHIKAMRSVRTRAQTNTFTTAVASRVVNHKSRSELVAIERSSTTSTESTMGNTHHRQRHRAPCRAPYGQPRWPGAEPHTHATRIPTRHTCSARGGNHSSWTEPIVPSHCSLAAEKIVCRTVPSGERTGVRS
jgi:hypothetical protein